MTRKRRTKGRILRSLDEIYSSGKSIRASDLSRDYYPLYSDILEPAPQSFGSVPAALDALADKYTQEGREQDATVLRMMLTPPPLPPGLQKVSQRIPVLRRGDVPAPGNREQYWLNNGMQDGSELFEHLLETGWVVTAKIAKRAGITRTKAHIAILREFPEWGVRYEDGHQVEYAVHPEAVERYLDLSQRLSRDGIPALADAWGRTEKYLGDVCRTLGLGAWFRGSRILDEKEKVLLEKVAAAASNNMLQLVADHRENLHTIDDVMEQRGRTRQYIQRKMSALEEAHPGCAFRMCKGDERSKVLYTTAAINALQDPENADAHLKETTTSYATDLRKAMSAAQAWRNNVPKEQRDEAMAAAAVLRAHNQRPCTQDLQVPAGDLSLVCSFMEFKRYERLIIGEEYSPVEARALLPDAETLHTARTLLSGLEDMLVYAWRDLLPTNAPYAQHDALAIAVRSYVPQTSDITFVEFASEKIRGA